MIGLFWWRMHVLLNLRLRTTSNNLLPNSEFRQWDETMMMILPDLIVNDGSGFSCCCPSVVGVVR